MPDAPLDIVSADAADRLVIAAHHPDRLRRPAARPGVVLQSRLQQALTWNVFRTLDLLPPAFWLRRLQLRLTGRVPTPAPQVVSVRLWLPLPLPPAQHLDGARADVIVDVVIETEHAVWTLAVYPDGSPGDDDGERMARMVDAGAWLAGAREHYCGVIAHDAGPGSAAGVLKARYARSSESVALRSATRGPAAPAPSGLGVLGWADLAWILHECGEADVLSPIERALARNAVAWLSAAAPVASG